MAPSAKRPSSSSTPPVVRSALFAELTGTQLYGILKLRTDVFVVEQHCAYPELDGRDAEPATIHLWIADDRDGAVAACARLLTETDGNRRIGRVATRADRRGAGLAGTLLTAALDLCTGAEVVLSAQAHLTAFYGRYGFVVAGPEYMDDGIPHRPMRKPGVPTTG